MGYCERMAFQETKVACFGIISPYIHLEHSSFPHYMYIDLMVARISDTLPL